MRIRRGGAQRKHERERGPDAQLALDPDAAAVCFHGHLAGGQPQACAHLPAGLARFHLTELVEDMAELVFGDALAIVGDGEQDSLPFEKRIADKATLGAAEWMRMDLRVAELTGELGQVIWDAPWKVRTGPAWRGRMRGNAGPGIPHRRR